MNIKKVTVTDEDRHGHSLCEQTIVGREADRPSTRFGSNVGDVSQH